MVMNEISDIATWCYFSDFHILRSLGELALLVACMY